MVGFAFGLAAAFFVAALLLFIRLQGVKGEKREAAQGAKTCAKELESERERKSAQLDHAQERLQALRDRLVECSDPGLIRDWIDDEFARVRRGDDDPDGPGAGA